MTHSFPIFFLFFSFFISSMDKLLQLSDHEILIDFALACKCRTTIRIKSLISTAPLAFKVQTSSPHKFLVNPPSGLIPPLSSAAFQIVLKPQPHLPPTFPRSPADRFLLKTAAVPDLTADSPESTHSDLVHRWFASFSGPTHDVKLKVYFVGPFLLTHAVAAGDLDAVRGIVKRQRSVVPELPPREAESLYRVAARHPDIAGLLLEAGLRIDVGGEVRDDARWAAKGWSGLHVAAAFDRADEVEELVKKKGLGVECRDKEGRTPLLLAAGKGHLRSAKVLVSAGAANVDARSKDGRTALYRAATNGDRPMVEMLLGAGADPTIGDVDHCRSAIGVARDKGHMDIVKVLEQGEAMLQAARRGELDLLELLLEKGANTNFCDQYGLTALHVAAIKGNKDVVMMLVEFGASVEWPDAEGHTPLHLAVEGGSIETVEVLICRGANVNAKTKKGATPLYISKLMEYGDVTKLLLDKGAAS